MKSTEQPHYGIEALAHNDSQNWEALQHTNQLLRIVEVVLAFVIICGLCFAL